MNMQLPADDTGPLMARIAELEEIERLANEAYRLQRSTNALQAEKLAKMPHTPDGTLVVLGETVIWRRRHDGDILHGVAVGCDVADKTVHAKWYAGDEYAYEQTTSMARCYGSEAELLKGETDA